MIDTKWLDKIDVDDIPVEDAVELVAIARRAAKLEDQLYYQIKDCANKAGATVEKNRCIENDETCNCSDWIYFRILND